MCLFRRNKKRNIHSILTPNDSNGVEPFLYSFLFFPFLYSPNLGLAHVIHLEKKKVTWVQGAEGGL